MTLDGPFQHILVVDEDGRVIDEHRINGVQIESPRSGAVAGPDEIVRLWVDPAVSVRDVRIMQNGDEIYRGSEIPHDVRLSTAVLEEEEWHRLQVVVTDEDGVVREQSSDFIVRRIFLRSPEVGANRVRGVLPVVASLGLGAEEQIRHVSLTFTWIRGLEEPVSKAGVP